MAEWWSIEVSPATSSRRVGGGYAYEDELTEAAITNGAVYYEWHDTEYGVIFEVLFPGDREWGVVPQAACGAGGARRGA